jgi:hypothetical protein
MGVEVYQQLVQAVLRRYHANAGKSLWDVYRLDRDFTQVDANMVDFVAENRVQILSSLENPELEARLVDLFCNATQEFTLAQNQFIQLTEQDKQRLKNIYHSYVIQIKQLLQESEDEAVLETGLEELLLDHFSDLRRNLSTYFDAEASGEPVKNVIFQQVVCGEYQAELQLEVLGIELSKLVEPVLDLGCGTSGLLVRHLNMLGISAIGVDRMVEPSELFIQASWLDLSLPPRSWGTVISHMAFSNHFNFHHLYRHGHPDAYARRYMNILNGLVPGGTFFYTPGLPFIEELLAEDLFHVDRHPVLPASIPGMMRKRNLYTARVTRIK